jgi:hypothetical protein
VCVLTDQKALLIVSVEMIVAMVAMRSQKGRIAGPIVEGVTAVMVGCSAEVVARVVAVVVVVPVVALALVVQLEQTVG